MNWKNIYPKQSIGVIGAGRFGTAIANLLAQKNKVILYARKKEAVENMIKKRIAAKQKLANNILPTHSLKEVAQQCEVIFIIISATGFKNLIQKLSPFLSPYHIIIHGIKGFISTQDFRGRYTIKTMSQIIVEESVIVKVGCISGPNLVSELAKKQPAATVVASQFEEVIKIVQLLLKNNIFQVYSSKDIIGVELCGALKNIIAIAAGCLSGMQYGDNTKALLLSRGMIEMIYIGKILGASVAPFIGLAGIGDLAATCANHSSRNFTFGYQLAQGKDMKTILHNIQETVEGINTVKMIKEYIQPKPIRAPITEMVYRMIFEKLTAQKALHVLMKYPFNVDVDFLA